MLLSLILILIGLPLLVLSADLFIKGALEIAQVLGMSTLLIGILIVGFGTSTPELLVSAIAAYSGSPSLALGNAYGSNIVNIALILGLTAVIRPITVQSTILKRELPILTILSIVAFIQLSDGQLSSLDAISLLGAFCCFVMWSIWQSFRRSADNLGSEVAQHLQPAPAIGRSILRLIAGLIFLIISSRMLVMGSVTIASELGISDLIIGLTIIALGTSLPELASSIVAARRNAHDIALGNIIGSNIFNALAVVGVSGTISPFDVPPEVLIRDLPVMIVLTIALFILGSGFGREGRINRIEGGLLLLSYGGYLYWLFV